MNSPVTSKRVFDSSSREIGNGTEYSAKIEILREDGTKSLADALARRTDTDEWTSVQATFVIQKFASQEGSFPSGTDLLTGIIDTKKEEVEGDSRWVTVSAIYIQQWNLQSPAQEVQGTDFKPRERILGGRIDGDDVFSFGVSVIRLAVGAVRRMGDIWTVACAPWAA